MILKTNENTNNTIDLTPLLEEMQILNKGVISNGEKLDQINEYLILKDQEDKESKEAEYKEEQEQKRSDDQEQADINETYTELLTDVRDQLTLQNHIESGMIFFMGVILGTLLVKILFDRFRKSV